MVSRTIDVAVALVRWAAALAYVGLAWGLDHDGVSVGDVTAMIAVGAALIILVCSLGWILDGPGQVDRDEP